MNNDIDGQDICVLGGTGTIGNALIERLLTFKPKRIRCVSNDEYSMWLTEKRFGPQSNTNPLRYVLKDIRNRYAIREVLRGVDQLYMLAAYKHVQYVEYSPQEAIDVNILGNKIVVEEALANGYIQKVVNISTDKVCYPRSTYGLSKAIVEKLVEWASFYRPVGEQITKFANVRFGNVVGSRGSVLERWFDPKTPVIEVRDVSHERFLMKTSEAIDLILQCTHDMKGGETYILKMPSVRIGDLATVAMEMTGKPIKVTSPLLGETQHQTLMTADESVRRKETESGFVLHRMFPERPPFEYSTKMQKPLDLDEIRKLLEEWKDGQNDV